MPTQDFTHSLVAYIEILGFKERARTLTDEFDKLTLDTLDANVASIQHRFFYQPQDPIERGIQVQLNQKTLAFYDCLVISVDLGSATPSGFTEFELIMMQLMRFAYSQGKCVLEGTFLNGGLDYGLWSYQENRLISPAMVTAYSTKKAYDSPFIALHPNLYEFLLNHPDRGEEKGEPLSICQENIEGPDRFWFLDYASLCLIERQWYEEEDSLRWLGAIPPERQEKLIEDGLNSVTANWLEKHAHSVKQGFLDASDEQSKSQFRAAAKYHNDVVKRWTKNNEVPLIDLTTPEVGSWQQSQAPEAIRGNSNAIPHLASFVDILGFSANVKSAAKDVDTLNRIIKSITSIQMNFEHNAKDSLTTGAHKALGKKVLAFSDSIVIGTSLEGDYAQVSTEYDLIMGELLSLALSQGDCVLGGTFLRGGVDIGAWSYQDERLISPALSRAYDLESKVVMPVIALSEDLFSKLLSQKERRDDSFARILSNRDDCPFYFLNYMQVHLDSLDWRWNDEQYKNPKLHPPTQEAMDTGIRKNTHRWLRCHSEVIEKAHKKSTSTTVKAKYEWLASYHNGVMERLDNEFHIHLLHL